MLFLIPDKLCRVLCKKLTNSSNPVLADGIYLVTTLLVRVVESQRYVVGEPSKETVWDPLKASSLWSADLLSVDGSRSGGFI